MPVDLDGDGATTVSDVLAVLSAFGVLMLTIENNRMKTSCPMNSLTKLCAAQRSPC